MTISYIFLFLTGLGVIGWLALFYYGRYFLKKDLARQEYQVLNWFKNNDLPVLTSYVDSKIARKENKKNFFIKLLPLIVCSFLPAIISTIIVLIDPIVIDENNPDFENFPLGLYVAMWVVSSLICIFYIWVILKTARKIQQLQIEELKKFEVQELKSLYDQVSNSPYNIHSWEKNTKEYLSAIKQLETQFKNSNNLTIEDKYNLYLKVVYKSLEKFDYSFANSQTSKKENYKIAFSKNIFEIVFKKEIVDWKNTYFAK
ncbi:hypothetical protein ACA758_00710 [Mycoplasmopsis agassizii]|uniref:hypothetical protein n=1 Tax=Mycoplasmopsis agassizii TaxID=33922 RepID=UPI0035287528